MRQPYLVLLVGMGLQLKHVSSINLIRKTMLSRNVQAVTVTLRAV